MIKEQNIWAKTMILSYRYLGALCKAIDRLVEIKAKNSMYSYGYTCGENSVLNISSKLIALTNKKIDYINLKVVVEKSLEKMSKNASKILILKYIHQLSSLQVAQILGLSLRTCFRKSNAALSEFENCLADLGFTKEKLELIYLDDSFISSIYNTIKNHNHFIKELTEIPSSEKIFNQYINELLSKSVC